MTNTDELIQNIGAWAAEKGLLKPENALAQMCKVSEEVGETSSALLKQNSEALKDGIGDIAVTIIILALQKGFTLNECLEAAWNEIKGRTGKTKDGIFIKD